MGLSNLQQGFKLSSPYTFLSVIGLGLLYYFPIFYHLDTPPIFMWDEARLALNAYEMNESGDYIVTTCKGKPDLWNTKPPLMIWLQVFWMKILGVGELAVRLPSALAACFTIIGLLAFSKKILNNIQWGIIASFVLITAGGYICSHGSRTGDYDAVLTFFKMLYALSFFAFIETEDSKLKNRYFILFFVALIAAVMTKGIVGFLMCPILLLYALYRKQVVDILKNSIFYMGVVSLVIIVGGYIMLREQASAGYIEAMLENDIVGRYAGKLQSAEGIYVESVTKDDFGYIFRDLKNRGFSWWFWWLPLGVISIFTLKNKLWQRFAVYSTLLTVFVVLMISNSDFKASWYILPIYPFMGFIVGSVLYQLWNFVRQTTFISSDFLKLVIANLLIVALMAAPYFQIFENNKYEASIYAPKESHFLQHVHKGHFPAEGLVYMSIGYDIHARFYLKKLAEKGTRITLKAWSKIEKGDKIISYHADSERYIAKNLVVKNIMDLNGVLVYEVIDRKVVKE